jgi:head-tail adaptor
MQDISRPGRINAGRLDRRITIERLGPKVDNGLRVENGGWFEVCERFAALQPLSGAERVVAAENAAVRTQKFRIRRPASFTLEPGSYRLRYGGLPYDITDVQEVDRGWLDVVGTARAESATAT